MSNSYKYVRICLLNSLDYSNGLPYGNTINRFDDTIRDNGNSRLFSRINADNGAPKQGAIPKTSDCFIHRHLRIRRHYNVGKSDRARLLLRGYYDADFTSYLVAWRDSYKFKPLFSKRFGDILENREVRSC
jgi:hypothetical protein